MEKLTVLEVMKLKNCGKTTVYRWITKGWVNSVIEDETKFVINDGKLESVTAGNTGVKKDTVVTQPQQHREKRISQAINSENAWEALVRQVTELQKENTELKQRIEKLESNPLLATAKQPIQRNPTVFGFGLRFVNNRWIAYKRIYNKLYNVYVGNDVSQAEQKIKAWLSERPEIHAKLNI